MKRMLINVEGHSEKEFVDKVLTHYFFSRDIQRVDCFKFKHTRGCLTKYDHLKKDLIHSVHECEVIISTLIDFYALPADYPNPEDINQGKSTAPSKRLHQLIPGYSKVNHGVAIVQNAGIDVLFQKCPRFKAWADRLIENAKSN